MLKYDRDLGGEAQLDDLVKIVHTASDMDGMTGQIGGWGDLSGYIALIILDDRYMGRKVVGMPVVCLVKV